MRTRINPKRGCNSIDLLEPRRLLSAALSGTQLVITGTTGNDSITLTYNSSSLRFAATINGVVSSFVASKVRSVNVLALAGNDVVTMPASMPASKPITADLGAGNDTFNGTNRSDSAVGGPGNDTLNGNNGDDNLVGNDGNDVLAGGPGNADRIFPGLGNDTATGGSGTFDTVSYQDRTDNVTVRIDGAGSSGNVAAGETDTISADFENAVGGAGNDLVIGNAGANIVGGAQGNDTLDGGKGADKLYGDEGNDTVTYAARTAPIFARMDDGGFDGEVNEDDWLITSEIIIGGSSNDFLAGDDLANTLIGGGGNDTLDGGGGNDSLQGDNGRDSLIGGNGRDRIRGGNHNDTILGGNHADTIFGDGGNDTIDGGKLADVINGGAGTDTSTRDSTDRMSLIEALK